MEPETFTADQPEVQDIETQQPEVQAQFTPEADEIATLFYGIKRKFEMDDEDAHSIFFDQALKAENYWNNRQHSYKGYDSAKEILTEIDDDDESTRYTGNIYRPNGESIIAAMSISPPHVSFFPDDASNSDDLETAEAYQRICGLIEKHNKAPMLIARALYIIYNQHFAAFYNYTKSNNKYGTYPIEIYKQQQIEKTRNLCPNCGAEADGLVCQICHTEFIEPNQVKYIETVNNLVGYSSEPKSRECIKVFGPMHVKIAPYVQDQEDTPYLILKFEAHPSKALKEFSDFKDKIKSRPGSDVNDEREGRATIHRADINNLDAWEYVWFRPQVYHLFKESNEKYFEYLSNTFPDGVKLLFINDCLVEIVNENLDDHWTFTHHPLSQYIYAEPAGRGAISPQDASNELLNLSMDSVKHGISQTFVPTDLLDADQYSQRTIRPGDITFIKPIGQNENINSKIYSTRTTSLSQEVKEVREDLKQLSQLAVGAFPSIYGGILQGSRTASEYAQSRNQALQRLSILWTLIKETWADLMGKATVSYARNLKWDEKEVQKQGKSFVNIWIKQAQLKGKIGSVEPEVDEQLPTSWAQLRDVFMRLLELNTPMINEVLSLPENAEIIKGALGANDICIPGADDRLKQLSEIQEMLNGQQVPIDPELDNHYLEAETCRNFLIKSISRQLDPNIKAIIYQHYLQHRQLAMTTQMQQNTENQNPNKQENKDV